MTAALAINPPLTLRDYQIDYLEHVKTALGNGIRRQLVEVNTRNHKTQRQQILTVLVEAKGGWVSLLKIADCAKQYNARIYELRHLGFRILNRTQEIDGVSALMVSP